VIVPIVAAVVVTVAVTGAGRVTAAGSIPFSQEANMVSDKVPFTIDQAIDALARCREQLGGDAGVRFADGEPVVRIVPAGDEAIVTDRTGDEDEYK
jgi:hypothetical protein